MTKAFLPIAFGLAVMLSPSRADDITLTDGTVLKNAKIIARDDSKKTVTIAFSGGTAEVHSEMVPATLSTAQPPTVTNAASETTPVIQPPTPPPSTQGHEDWTVAGKTYHNVVVGNVYPDRVEITFDGGVGTPLLADLSPELQKRFNYDPKAVKEMQAERQEQEQQDADAQKAKESEVFVAGTVLQKVEGGVILQGIPEGTPWPWNDVPKGMRAVAQFDRVFIKGYDGAGVDGALVEVTASPSGTFSYTTVLGASSTIRAYTAISQ
jgi:hypothetical protein